MDLRRWWQNQPQVQRWMLRRAPPAQQVTLNQRRVFIFLSRNGGLYALVVLITFIAGINYANNLLLLVCYLLAAVLVVGLHQTFWQLAGLQLTLLDEAVDAVAGGQATVRFQVEGRRVHRGLTLMVSGAHGVQVCHIDRLTTAQVVSWPVVVGERRGWLPLPRLTVSSSAPLGILRSWSHVTFAGGVWVSPRPQATQAVVGQAVTHEGNADAAAGQQAGPGDFDQLQAWRPGESLGRLSWRHLARGQGLWAKQFVVPIQAEMWVDYRAMPGPGHEARLAQMAHAIEARHAQAQAYGVWLPNAQLAVAQGTAQRLQALRLLAQAPG